MAGKAAGKVSAARSDLSELRKRLSARMGSRHTAPFLQRRLPYPVVDGRSESKSVFGRKAPVVRMLRAGAAYGSEKVAAVPVVSEPWRKRTAGRYARGAEKNFQSMRGKNGSIAAGTVPSLLRVRQRIFAEAAVGSRIQNRKAGQSIIKKAAREAELSRDSKRVRLVCRKTSMYAGIDSLSAKISAVIYSLVETAKTHGLNPASYLQYILTTLPRGSLPGDCLPWLPAVQAICKA